MTLFRRIERWLLRCKYKSGAKFTVHLYDDKPRVMIEIYVENAKDPHQMTHVARTWEPAQEEMRDERLFYEALYQELINLEIHEIQEWFKIDERNYVDPHPEIPF